MCLIVDVNVVPNVFFSDDDPDFQAIHNALFKPHTLKAKLAYGGKLTTEYARMSSMLRLLRALDAQGSTIPVDDHLVNAEEERLIALGVCKSNDTHILALARVSKSHLLCSKDSALAEDFDNPNIINDPRGKVYNRASHKPLLTEFCKSK